MIRLPLLPHRAGRSASSVYRVRRRSVRSARSFAPKNGSPLAEAASQKLVYGTLSDKNGHLLDACYAVVFRAPHTYTGEDMAEIQCHGSTAVLTAALDALFAHGVRQAEAGEFTRRAFPRTAKWGFPRRKPYMT